MSESRTAPPFDELVEFLRTVPIFGGLGDAALRLLYDEAEWRRYPAGERLVNQGDLAREMFVVLDGVAAVHHAPDGPTLCELSRGQCAGEMSLIDIQPRSASVTARTPVDVMVLGFDDVARLSRTSLETYTLLVMNIAREISRRLRAANRVIARLGEREIVLT